MGQKARGRHLGRTVTAYVLAVVLPLAVAVAIPHPAAHLVVPESIMLGVAVLSTLLDGWIPGVVAVVSSITWLWYIDSSPPFSFRLPNASDGVALAVSGLVSLSLVITVSVLRDRDLRAVAETARLESDLQYRHLEAIEMQRALLPERALTVEGIDIQWLYQPGGEAAVGGDWAAFVPFSTTAVGVAIGDVAGHGVDAVAEMAGFRFELRACAADGASPSVVLERLNRLAHLYPLRSFSSCVYGVMDVAEGLWTFANAGHPPPVLVRRGKAELLDDFHGLVLGVRETTSYETRDIKLQPNDVVVLYTDGLVERRFEHLDSSMARLRDLAATIDTRALNNECSRLTRALAGDDPEDDVAVVLLGYQTERAAHRIRKVDPTQSSVGTTQPEDETSLPRPLANP